VQLYWVDQTQGPCRQERLRKWVPRAGFRRQAEIRPCLWLCSCRLQSL